MSNRLIELRTVAALDDLLASPHKPVLIYKHSMTCGTSAYAYEEILDLVAGLPADVSIGMVRVQTARAVSDEIAQRFQVRHESPQVLLLRDGDVVWRASHFGVTAEAIEAALAR
jgi:bacillithiol system protein YtxJ